MDYCHYFPPKRDLPTAAEEFAAAKVVYSAPAPADAHIVAARDRGGNYAHVCWETHLLDQGQPPYWSRMDTCEPFKIVAWVPSSWTVREMLEEYPQLKCTLKVMFIK